MTDETAAKYVPYSQTSFDHLCGFMTFRNARIPAEVLVSSQPTVESGIETTTQYKRGFDFWMVFIANLTVDMLSALDLVGSITVVAIRKTHTFHIDCGVYSIAYHCGSSPRYGLYMGRKRVHNRIYGCITPCRRTGLNFREKADIAHVCVFIRPRIRYIRCSTEHDHVDSWPWSVILRFFYSYTRRILTCLQQFKGLVAAGACLSQRSSTLISCRSRRGENSKALLHRSYAVRIVFGDNSDVSVVFGLWHGTAPPYPPRFRLTVRQRNRSAHWRSIGRVGGVALALLPQPSCLRDSNCVGVLLPKRSQT